MIRIHWCSVAILSSFDSIWCDMVCYTVVKLFIVCVVMVCVCVCVFFCPSNWFVLQISLFLFLLYFFFVHHTMVGLMPTFFCPDTECSAVMAMVVFTNENVYYFLYLRMDRKYGCWLKIDQSTLKSRVQTTNTTITAIKCSVLKM